MAQENYSLLLGLGLKSDSVSKIEEEIKKIQVAAQQKAKINITVDTIFDKKGRDTGEAILSLMANYTDGAGRAVTETQKLLMTVNELNEMVYKQSVGKTINYADKSAQVERKKAQQDDEVAAKSKIANLEQQLSILKYIEVQEKENAEAVKQSLTPTGKDLSSAKKLETESKSTLELQKQLEVTNKIREIEQNIVLQKDQELSKQKEDKANTQDKLGNLQQQLTVLKYLEAEEIKIAEATKKSMVPTAKDLSSTKKLEDESRTTLETEKQSQTKQKIANIEQQIATTKQLQKDADAKAKADAKEKENSTRTILNYNKEQAKEEAKALALEEKQLNIMDRQIQKAQKFLERSKTLNQSQPNVQQGIQVANQIINEKDPAKVQELTDKLSVLKQGITGTNSANLSFSEGMKRSITTIGEYALGAGILYGAFNQLQQGLKYVIDLNKEMTNIKVLGVSGATSDVEINNLAKSYNTLASSLGVTTIEVAKGSVEWLRQGKTIAETEELLRSTMMLSKLGALDSAQATEYLTSTLNGFKMETSDASSVVDKLISVD